MKKILLAIFLCCTADVTADPLLVAQWNLPKKLSDQNTAVRFELDSTWHMVHGKTSDITGEAHLKDSTDPRSVILELSIPVASFDTDNSMRDSTMRDVMSADKYKMVSFRGEGLDGKCTPALVLQQQRCSDVLTGVLQIMAVRETISIPVEISQNQESAFIVKGSFPVRWADYGVEDPSILIASVDPVVTIFFESTL